MVFNGGFDGTVLKGVERVETWNVLRNGRDH